MKQLDIETELLRQGETRRILVRGNSMRPYLVHERDYVCLKKLQEVHVGDIVLAEVQPSRYIMHRVIGIDGKGMTMRGDGNLTTEKCSVDDVRGTAIAFVRKGNADAEPLTTLHYRIYRWFWMHNPMLVRRVLLKIHAILFDSCKDLRR